MKIPKPVFNKECPKKYKTFFSPNSDDEYKAKHPLAYKIIVTVGITVLLLPMIIYVLVCGSKDVESGWLMLGLAGSFIIGIGLFNIVAAWLGQYLGHMVTFVCLLGGGSLVAISSLLLFNKTLYNLFDQEVVSFCFVSLLFLMMPAIYYVLFRASVRNWLMISKRMSKSKIKKSTIGKRNYWWYEQIHRENDIGGIYYLNRIFTVLYPLTFIFTLLTGLIRVMSIPICIMSIVTYLLMVIMCIFSKVQNNIENHGRVIVLYARNSNDLIDSVVFDIFEIIWCLLIAYCHLKITLDLWGF